MEEERDECQQLYEKSLMDLQQLNRFSALLIDKKMKELFALCKAYITALMSQVSSSVNSIKAINLIKRHGDMKFPVFYYTKQFSYHSKCKDDNL